MPDTLETATGALLAEKIKLFAAGLSKDGIATLLGFFHLTADRFNTAPVIAMSLDPDGRVSLHIEVHTAPD